MISFEQAKQIALDNLDKISPADLMLNEEATLEKPYGWYFLPCDRESGIGSMGRSVSGDSSLKKKTVVYLLSVQHIHSNATWSNMRQASNTIITIFLLYTSMTYRKPWTCFFN